MNVQCLEQNDQIVNVQCLEQNDQIVNVQYLEQNDQIGNVIEIQCANYGLIFVRCLLHKATLS